MSMPRTSAFLAMLGLMIGVVGCRKEDPSSPENSEGPTPLALHLPSWMLADTFYIPVVQGTSPLTVEGVALGRALFYETALSNDQTMSCATCHVQANAFSDPRQFSVGTDGSLGRRNAPAIMNPIYDTAFFWDGRAPSLEHQAFGPVTNPVEMANSWAVVVDRLEQDPTYPGMFQAAFGTPDIDSVRIVQAIAQFERTLLSFDSRFDRWYYGGDSTQLTQQEQRGFNLFMGEAQCADCHTPPLFHDVSFRNIGLHGQLSDLGVEEVTGLMDDRWRFKTSTLRNIEVTAPYMRDGRFTTLEEVVDFYADDVEVNMPNLDPHMFPWSLGQIELDPQERADLVAFMRTLTDASFLSDPDLGPPF